MFCQNWRAVVLSQNKQRSSPMLTPMRSRLRRDCRLPSYCILPPGSRDIDIPCIADKIIGANIQTILCSGACNLDNTTKSANFKATQGSGMCSNLGEVAATGS
jgi:hypothetical protein